jgi:hypothetical protein
MLGVSLPMDQKMCDTGKRHEMISSSDIVISSGHDVDEAELYDFYRSIFPDRKNPQIWK